MRILFKIGSLFHKSTVKNNNPIFDKKILRLIVLELTLIKGNAGKNFYHHSFEQKIKRINTNFFSTVLNYVLLVI